MKTSSAKAKGRRLQQWFRELLIEELEIHPEDIESRSMGAGGEDLIMARAARQKFPLSIECKNQEKVNVWKAYEQCDANSKDYEPVVVIKKNNFKPLVVVDAEYFVGLFDEKEIPWDILAFPWVNSSLKNFFADLKSGNFILRTEDIIRR